MAAQSDVARSMELFAMGLRSDGYTPEIYDVDFDETLETAVAMGKRTAGRQSLGYRLHPS